MFKSIKIAVDTIVDELAQVADNAIDYALPTMVDLNVDQMMQGLNAEGQEIGEYRSPSYAEFKQYMNSRPAPFVPDLRLTGSFHSRMFAKRSGDEITFSSTDWKTDALVDKYGAIFGLTEENREGVTNNYIFPIITDWLSQQIRQI